MTSRRGQMDSSHLLRHTVIDGGYCIGCGACASLSGSPLRMQWNDEGLIEAVHTGALATAHVPVDSVCPFSDSAVDEDALATELFREALEHHAAVGRYQRCFVGSVADSATRESASSGGLGRFIAASLLTEGLVSRVAHVVPRKRTRAENPLFSYEVTTDPQQVLHGAKSAYYPVTLADIADQLFGDDSPIAVAGLPCFIKALRLIARNSAPARRNLKYTIGLFCGGMRSARYAELIAWQLNVHPDDLAEVDFREKYGDRPANHKGHRVRQSNGVTKLGSSKELFGTDYGMGFFKPKACDFCDDVTAELADVSIGDAWLPDHVHDPQGTSAVVVRSAAILELVERQRAAGRLRLQAVPAATIAKSQASSLRHRREGTRYRVERCSTLGTWSPPKRAFAVPPAPTHRRKLYDMREKIRDESHTAFRDALTRNEYRYFEEGMQPLVRRYRRLARPLPSRALGRIRTLLKQLAQRLGARR